MEKRWKSTDGGKTEGLRKNPVPMPLCPSQIPYGLIQTSTVRNLNYDTTLTPTYIADLYFLFVQE
jgi:hypothetical protein